MGGNEEPVAGLRRAVWSVAYADDPGTVSKSAKGLGTMMAVIVTVFEAVGLAAMETKTMTTLLPAPN